MKQWDVYGPSAFNKANAAVRDKLPSLTVLLVIGQGNNNDKLVREILRGATANSFTSFILYQYRSWAELDLATVLPAMPGLTELSFLSCDLDDAACTVIAQGCGAEHMRLRELTFNGNPRITIAGLRILGPALQWLEYLRIPGTDFDVGELQSVVTQTHASRDCRR